MLFNSVNFAFFLPIVFFLYWFGTRNSTKSQNRLLFFSSYFFYACWDWRFLFLLIFSTLLDYYTGIKISASEDKTKKKILFWLSISVNLGLLGVFKYFNFFSQSFSEACAVLGIHVSSLTLKVVLPIGISFYTFHGLSYVIDIYKQKITAEKNFIDYSVFVSFFPLLVAGPIERATHLLPQIKQERVFNPANAANGLRQILWGLFKKIVIADQCASYADLIFENFPEYSGSTRVLGAVLFTFQIYADFSGYSDIAIGTAKLFGIDLLKNFAFPYFSRNIAEFWRRWHISLSSWFKDYVYIPLGGSKNGTLKGVRNTLVIFLVSGLWHGANWTFVAWGLINALYVIPSMIFKTHKTTVNTGGSGKFFPGSRTFLQIITTFCFTVFAWIFFRSKTIHQAFQFISGIFTASLFTSPAFMPVLLILLIVLFMTIEWLGRDKSFALLDLNLTAPVAMRWLMYYLIIFSIFYFAGSAQQFIYFQF